MLGLGLGFELGLWLGLGLGLGLGLVRCTARYVTAEHAGSGEQQQQSEREQPSRNGEQQPVVVERRYECVLGGGDANVLLRAG